MRQSTSMTQKTTAGLGSSGHDRQVSSASWSRQQKPEERAQRGWKGEGPGAAQSPEGRFLRRQGPGFTTAWITVGRATDSPKLWNLDLSSEALSAEHLEAPRGSSVHRVALEGGARSQL